MSCELKFYLLYALLYGLILLIGEGLYRFLKLKPEWSRNFAHLTAGIISLPYPWIFTSHWWVLLIAVQSSGILYLTRRWDLFSSHHQSAGKSVGSYLFFASLYLCFLVAFYMHKPSYFVFPVLVLSVSDVSAALIGRAFGRKPEGFLRKLLSKSKTPAGTIAFLLSATMVLGLSYYYYLQTSLSYAFGAALLISVAASMAEGKSKNGFDNFFVPAITLIFMVLIDLF